MEIRRGDGDGVDEEGEENGFVDWAGKGLTVFAIITPAVFAGLWLLSS